MAHDPRARDRFHVQLARFDVAAHRELAGQVSHPLKEYLPGSPRLQRLYEQIELANRFTFPSEYRFNV